MSIAPDSTAPCEVWVVYRIPSAIMEDGWRVRGPDKVLYVGPDTVRNSCVCRGQVVIEHFNGTTDRKDCFVTRVEATDEATKRNDELIDRIKKTNDYLAREKQWS